MTLETSKIPLRTDNLPQEHQIQAHFALAAFATLKAKAVGYVSVPITSGKRLYDYMEEKGYTHQDQAKKDHDAFFKHVVTPNLEAGIQASETWTRKLDGIILAPAEFEKRLRGENIANWGQDDFMGMWIRLINEKVTHMILVDGWEYSNGSGEEYLQAALMQMGRGERSDIAIIDAEGKEITPDKGIALLGKAFISLNSKGMRPRNMAETLAILLETEQRYDFERSFGRSAEPGGEKAGKYQDLPKYDRKEILAIGAEVREILAKNYQDIMPVLKSTSSHDFTPMNALFRGGVKQKTPAPLRAA